MNRFYILFFILFIVSAHAQNFEEKNLLSKSYDSLLILYNNNQNDSLSAKQIAKSYISKAKNDGDSIKIARGYSKLALLSKRYIALKYLDTTILYSKNRTHQIFPAEGYILKSSLLYNNEEYEKSLQNAIIGYQYANDNKNIDQQLTALHQINRINELWGDYNKALETAFLTHKLIFENPEINSFSEHYLFSLEGIGKCYIRLKKPDSALIYFKKGIVEALKRKDSASYYAFVSRTGTALYKKEYYKVALDSLFKGDINRDAYNNSYLPYYYFYVGSCYYNMGNKEKGIFYFKKIDSIYQKRHVLNPELPLVYDKLVSFYRDKNEKEKQLEYLYKLVRVVRIIDEKRINIKEKTERDYLIPRLLEEKEELIADLNEKNDTSTLISWLILSFLCLSIIVLLYYFRRQRQFKNRFDKLIGEQEITKVKNINSETENNEISVKIIEEILYHLDLFEAENKFLSNEVSLNEMAKNFSTNSTYLSKVINLKKDKNFSQYINDLRIDYSIQLLETNPKFRKYTIKAIASECGFKSAESFSKGFYKKHGIYPSYFLKQLAGKKN